MNMRIFEGSGITATGKVLPLSQLKLFSDVESTEFRPERMTEVMKTAEKLLAEDIPLLPLSLYRQFQLTGNRSNFQTLCNKRKLMVLYFSIAEHYENRGRFTEKLADVIWAIMEESTWVYPAHYSLHPVCEDPSIPPVFGDNGMHGVGLCSASAAASLATAYYLVKDKLDAISPVIAKKIVYTLKERMIKPFLNVNFWWTGLGKKRPNNWGPWVVSNVLYVTALTESDDVTREMVVNRALNCLDNYTEIIPEDGGCDEGPGYWNAAGACLFDCLELLYDITGGKINIFDLPHVKNIGEYPAKMNIHGNRYVNFADCSPNVNYDGAMLCRYGRKIGSASLESFGRHVAATTNPVIASGMCYRSVRSLIDPVSEDCAVTAVPLSYMENLQIMIARDGEKTDSGLFLAVKGGSNGESHNHNDVGNFIIYKDAKPVIIDVGVGTYTKQTFSPDRYKLWFMQSGYHNLPSFGGADQMQGEKFKAAEVTFDAKGRSMSANITGAYTEAAQLEYYNRSVKLDMSKVSILDKFKRSENPSDKKTVFHLMSAAEPKIIEHGKIALAEGCTLTYDTALDASVEAFDPVGLDAMGAWNTDTLYRICLSTEALEGEFLFTVE